LICGSTEVLKHRWALLRLLRVGGYAEKSSYNECEYPSPPVIKASVQLT
jgi:hypothetical protein